MGAGEPGERGCQSRAARHLDYEFGRVFGTQGKEAFGIPLGAPLAQGTELVVSRYVAVIRRGFVCEHWTPLISVSKRTLWGQTQELWGRNLPKQAHLEILRLVSGREDDG